MSTLIETTRTANRLVISIPADSLSEEQIRRLVDLVIFESIVGRSKLTQKDADEISDEIKHSWWKKNGSRIKKMVAEAEAGSE